MRLENMTLTIPPPSPLPPNSFLFRLVLCLQCPVETDPHMNLNEDDGSFWPAIPTRPRGRSPLYFCALVLLYFCIFVFLYLSMTGVFDPRSHHDPASRGGSPFQDGRAQTCQKIQQRSTIWENAISDGGDMLKCFFSKNIWSWNKFPFPFQIPSWGMGRLSFLEEFWKMIIGFENNGP